MTRDEVYEKLLLVFQDVIDDRRININDSNTSKDIMEWDSLMHIQLIDVIQDEFGIEFSVEEAYSTRNVGELVSLIIKKRTE